jgi:hypothetical protein
MYTTRYIKYMFFSYKNVNPFDVFGVMDQVSQSKSNYIFFRFLQFCRKTFAANPNPITSSQSKSNYIFFRFFCQSKSNYIFFRFLQFCRKTFAGMWIMYGITLFTSRMYVFYDIYTELGAIVIGEQYLLHRCNDPEFFSNIRQHTDLCTTVLANARQNNFLKALNKTLQGLFPHPSLTLFLIEID